MRDTAYPYAKTHAMDEIARRKNRIGKNNSGFFRLLPLLFLRRRVRMSLPFPMAGFYRCRPVRIRLLSLVLGILALSVFLRCKSTKPHSRVRSMLISARGTIRFQYSYREKRSSGPWARLDQNMNSLKQGNVSISCPRCTQCSKCLTCKIDLFFPPL